MTQEQIISSGLLESYVLGSTSPEETALVNRLCTAHPELLREIEAIEESLLNFSKHLAQPLNPRLKAKIAESLPSDTAGVKIVPLSKRSANLYKLGIAASLFICGLSLVYNVRLHQQLGRLRGELAGLNAAKSYMAQEMQVQQASLSVMRQQLDMATAPNVKKIVLNGMNSLAAKTAAILWNTETKEVYFDATTLSAPPGKQYQLWAIVDGKPVDAGLIDAGAGNVLQKMKAIPVAQAFAVTVERMGGSPTPSLETMCLLGKV